MTLEERILELKKEIRAVRIHLVPELEHTRADFGGLINYFEAKFNELEHWFETVEIDKPKSKSKSKSKSKNGRKGKQ